MNRFALTIFAALVSALAPAAWAQAPEAPAPAAPAPAAPAPAAPAPAAPVHPPGYHTHDGLFLQFAVGVGPMGSKATSRGSDWEFSGTGSQFGLAIGYAVVPNLVLAADFWAVGVRNPTLKGDGASLGATGTGLELAGIGLNLTYYLMPINAYFTVAPSSGALSPKAWGNTHSTEAGFAIRLAVGKEWWVSDNWGLGLNAQYVHGSNKDRDFPDKPEWSTSWFGLAFSATYN